MSKTDPKDDPKKQEFFSMMDEYFEGKKVQYLESKKDKKTSKSFLDWIWEGDE